MQLQLGLFCAQKGVWLASQRTIKFWKRLTGLGSFSFSGIQIS